MNKQTIQPNTVRTLSSLIVCSLPALLNTLGYLITIFTLFWAAPITTATNSTSTWIWLATGLILILLTYRQPFWPARQVALLLPLLYLFSSRVGREYSFLHNYQAWELVVLVSIGALTSVGLQRIKLTALVAIATLAISTTSIIGVLAYSQGNFLAADDHLPFLYRLILLKEQFPYIPFYNTDWNAGYDAREFFASGTLNFYLLFWPFIALFPVTKIYTLLVCLLLFVLAPILNGYACWLLSKNRMASFCCAALTMTSSSLLYKWAFAFGTIGFLTSLSLLPFLVVAGVYYLQHHSPKLWAGVGLAILAALCCFWPLGAILLLPTGLISLPYIFKKLNHRPIQVLCLAFLLLYVPWLMIFISSSPVAQYAAALPGEVPAPIRSVAPLSWGTALTKNITAGQTLNPILLAGSLLGLTLIQHTLVRRALLASYIWYLVLGLIVSQLKPQLELDRLLLVMYGLLCVPGGIGLAALLESLKAGNVWRRLLALPLLGILLTSPYWLYRIINNQGGEPLIFVGNTTHELAAAISQHAGQGRTMIAGFALHELDGGHVAPLPALSGKPMVASGFYHNKWHYEDVIPAEFRAQGKPGILKYLDLMNVSLIVTHEKFWRKWFSKRKLRFEVVSKIGRFTLFKRKQYTPSYLLAGDAEITTQRNSVTIYPKTTNLILKYKYFSFLRSSICTIEEYPVGAELSLIELKDCPIGEKVVIKSATPLERIWQRKVHQDRNRAF